MTQIVKKYMLAVAVVIISGNAFAAGDDYTTRTETKTITYTDSTDIHYHNRYHAAFIDNWSVEVMGGVRTLFAEEDSHMKFGKRIAPGFQLGLTKNVTPDVSFRATFGYGRLYGWNSGESGLYKGTASWSEVDPVRTYLEGQGVDCSNGYKQEIRHYTFGLDFMIHLWNIWTSNNQVNRRWNPYFFVGTEYFQILKHKGYAKTNKVGLHAGFKCDVNITKRLAATGEISGSIHEATFDNEIGKGSRHDFYVSTMVGLKYRLGKQGYRTEMRLSKEEFMQLQGKVTQINNTYEVPAVTKVLPNELLAPSVVFDKGENTFSTELQMVNLSRMAEYMNANPSLKISVIGNTHSVSQKLAKERAQIICQVLESRYGISKDRLSIATLDVNKEYNVTGYDQAVNFGVAQ